MNFDNTLTVKHKAKTDKFALRADVLMRYEDKYRSWYQSHVVDDKIILSKKDLEWMIENSEMIIETGSAEVVAFIKHAPFCYLENIEWFHNLLDMKNSKYCFDDIVDFVKIECLGYKIYTYDINSENEFKSNLYKHELTYDIKSFSKLDYVIVY